MGGKKKKSKTLFKISKFSMTEPELILKKRTRNELWASKKAKIDANNRKKVSKNKIIAFKRAEKYAHEYKQQEAIKIWLKREAKRQGGFYVPAEAKLALAIRIKGINGNDPKFRKNLRILRLGQINNSTFIKLNKASINLLRRVEHCISYGYPNIKTVRKLIYKRGYAKINGKRIALTDNSIIEKELGNLGILCLEDLVHEIVTLGPHFKEVNNFLWPFHLSSPLGGYVNKRRHFIEGGDAGNHEEKINKLAHKMI